MDRGQDRALLLECKSLHCTDAALLLAHWPMMYSLSAYAELLAKELLLSAWRCLLTVQGWHEYAKLALLEAGH